MTAGQGREDVGVTVPSRAFVRRVGVPWLAASAAAALVSGGIAYAGDSSQGTVIHGCVNKVTRVIRIASRCKSTEVVLTWNVRGPAGPAGPLGLHGSQGVQGPGEPWLLEQAFPAARATPLVTVLDGHPHTLAFLAAINQVPLAALGVAQFGQSGSIEDLYRYNGIDTDSIIRAALDLAP